MAKLEWYILLVAISASLSQVLGDLNSTCGDNIRCSIVDSICVNGICTCNSGFTVDTTQTRCLKVATGYNDPCEDENQCIESLGEGAQCENQQCICMDHYYHYVHGKCHMSRNVNDPCNNDDECFDGSENQATSCQNGTCRCTEGFYERGRTACRRQMKNIGDECLLDRDCDFNNGTCVLHKCVADGRPIVTVGSSQIVKSDLKKEGGITIGSDCKNNTDCQSIGHSICDVSGKCICKKSHFPSIDKANCIPEIGEACNSEKDALHVEHAVCRENMWTCPITKVVTKDSRNCVDLIEKIGKKYEVIEQCLFFGPNIDYGKNTCQCKTASIYKEKKHFCWHEYLDMPEIGTYCKDNSECDTENSVCQDNKCSCKKRYFELEGRCASGLNGKCKWSRDCVTENAWCDYENFCQCKRDFILTTDGKCLPKMAEKCTNSSECLTVNTHCRNGSCQCLPGLSLLEEKCVPRLESYCESDDECGISNSICENNQCNCKKRYEKRNGQCIYRGLDAECENNDQCKFVNNSVCLNKTCQCKKDYVITPDYDCVPKAGIHEDCTYNVECFSATPNTFCNATNVCECTENYHFNGGICHPKRLLGDGCVATDECFITNSVCNGRCVCKSIYKEVNGQCNSSTVTGPVFSLIALILMGLKALF